ncbi:hypothetical protein JOC70_003159 [Clostridium pascui]|nr:hypothetical protein [Clostridium pascui]
MTQTSIICILVFFIIVVVNMFGEFLPLPGTTGESLVVKIYGFIQIISAISTPIIGLILLKLVCEALYKLVRACEIILKGMIINKAYSHTRFS